MIDPAALGTARIGLERVRHDQSMADQPPARDQAPTARARRLARTAATSLRGLADAIERTWPAGSEPLGSDAAQTRGVVVWRGDVEDHPVPTRL